MSLDMLRSQQMSTKSSFSTIEELNRSDESQSGSEDTRDSNGKSGNLIINYLPYEFDDNALQHYFGRFGHILERKVMRDKKTRKSLGYGFVRYATHEEAERAISECNGVELLEKRIKVSFARPACDDIKDCKLFVTNIPHDYSENSVRKVFEKYGRIIECRVVSASMTRKTIAFIQFDRRSQAKKAIEEMHGYLIPGHHLPLDVKFAEYTCKVDSLYQEHKINPRRNVSNHIKSTRIPSDDSLSSGMTTCEVSEPNLTGHQDISYDNGITHLQYYVYYNPFMGTEAHHMPSDHIQGVATNSAEYYSYHQYCMNDIYFNGYIGYIPTTDTMDHFSLISNEPLIRGPLAPRQPYRDNRRKYYNSKS